MVSTFLLAVCDVNARTEIERQTCFYFRQATAMSLKQESESLAVYVEEASQRVEAGEVSVLMAHCLTSRCASLQSAVLLSHDARSRLTNVVNELQAPTEDAAREWERIETGIWQAQEDNEKQRQAKREKPM